NEPCWRDITERLAAPSDESLSAENFTGTQIQLRLHDHVQASGLAPSELSNNLKVAGIGVVALIIDHVRQSALHGYGQSSFRPPQQVEGIRHPPTRDNAAGNRRLKGVLRAVQFYID